MALILKETCLGLFPKSSELEYEMFKDAYLGQKKKSSGGLVTSTQCSL